MYDEYPFELEFISMPLEYEMAFSELNAGNVGVKYSHVHRDIVMKITAITYYADKTSIINSITYPALTGDWVGSFDGSLFPDNFYESKSKGKPVYIEFIVYPTGCYPCKWSIKVKEEN